MRTRTHGTLKKWNDERGFGFILPNQGTEELFVHISAFPRDGERPRVSELVSFETETGPDGKLRATRVMRPAKRAAPHRHSGTGRSNHSTGAVGTVLALLAMAVIGVYGYSHFKHTPQSPPSVQALMTSPAHSTFRCDGRTTCPEMTSCAEARYFIEHCPNTEMDGDKDGNPCEMQWCN